MALSRTCVAWMLVVILGCSSTTEPRVARLQLVDGAGGSLNTGSLQLTAFSMQAANSIDITFTLKNVGATDTSLALSPCPPQVRLYTAASGGTRAYPTDAGAACVAMAMFVTLKPGEERAQQVTLVADAVASTLSPNRYYMRLAPSYVVGVELSAGIVDRP